MNGVRRFLGSATSPSPQQKLEPIPSPLTKVSPLSFSPKQTWLSSSPFTSNSSQLQSEVNPNATPSLTISKKDRPKQVSLRESPTISVQDDPSSPSPSFMSVSPVLKSSTRSLQFGSPQRSQTMPSSPSSNVSLLEPSSNPRKSDPGWQRDSDNSTKREELLLSIMASEAIIDCREFNILGSDEVEELKKEHHVLSSRLVAITRKLALETKIRDAALNLSRMNSAHKKVSKQTSDQLEAANNRVELAQKELWRISDKANEVYRRIMEHRAGVLSHSLRNLEKKMVITPEDEGYESSNRSTLGLLSPFSSPSISAKSRFSGAHLFAGHADAIVPRPLLSADTAMAELAKAEEKLKEVKVQLLAARKKQADMARELSIVRLEKEEVETTLGMDLQAAEETITALEKELPRLEEVNNELQRLRQEKTAWETERIHLTKAVEETSIAKEDLETGVTALQLIAHDFGIGVLPPEPAMSDLIDKVGNHLQMMQAKLDKTSTEWDRIRRRLEDEVQAGLDNQKMLTMELEDARKARDAITRPPSLNILPSLPSKVRLSESPGLPADESELNVPRISAILQPIWAILPSPEARAVKIGNNANKIFRTGSPVPSTPSSNFNSLSELDVRTLKTLYDTRQHGSGGIQASGGEPFSIEGFAQRVQALVNDDKALIERLIRFAQAHDLLKKNAERAQKLAQDGNAAMETYQKQVKLLEERNISLSSQYSSMQEDISTLQENIERATADKHELERLAAEQADQIRQLSEANNALSTQTLQLAEDAAQAPEMIRKQMDAQLLDLKQKLEAAEDELTVMKTSEQTQRIALLDELNTMQTENSNLIAQLRAVKR